MIINLIQQYISGHKQVKKRFHHFVVFVCSMYNYNTMTHVHINLHIYIRAPPGPLYTCMYTLILVQVRTCPTIVYRMLACQSYG